MLCHAEGRAAMRSKHHAEIKVPVINGYMVAVALKRRNFIAVSYALRNSST